MPSRLATSAATALGSAMAAMVIIRVALIHLAGTPAHAAPRSCCGQPGRRALGNQLALELGEGCEDAEGKPAVGGRCVDLGSSAGQHLEADTADAQILGRDDEMSKIAAETVELP